MHLKDRISLRVVLHSIPRRLAFSATLSTKISFDAKECSTRSGAAWTSDSVRRVGVQSSVNWSLGRKSKGSRLIRSKRWRSVYSLRVFRYSRLLSSVIFDVSFCSGPPNIKFPRRQPLPFFFVSIYLMHFASKSKSSSERRKSLLSSE